VIGFLLSGNSPALAFFSNVSVMATNPFRRITIIGVGLIGGSLGLAIKKRFPSVHVVGVDRKVVLERALEQGAIDGVETDIARAVQDADLVFLATPLSVILQLIPVLARHCKPAAVVSDVGSVKLEVVRRVAGYFPRRNFIGGHPMAGIELSGIEAAHPLLFENAIYVLTPTTSNPPALVKRFGNFLGMLGTRVVSLDPRTHDEVVSAVSHVPQLAAVALMNVAGQRHTTARNYLRLAAGGISRYHPSRFEPAGYLEAHLGHQQGRDLEVAETPDSRAGLVLAAPAEGIAVPVDLPIYSRSPAQKPNSKDD
jgi:prephenate dehydrogenase